MIVISEKYADLLNGYAKIRELENALVNDFFDALRCFIETVEQEYRREIEQWRETRKQVSAELNRKRRAQNLALVFVFASFLGDCVLVDLLQNISPGWGHSVGVVLFIVLLVVLIAGTALIFIVGHDIYSLEKRKGVSSPKPISPLESLGENPWEWLHLEKQWIREIGRVGDLSDRDAGFMGESRLMECLAGILPNEYLGIRRVLVTPSLDIDVLLIGPTGIWILESKYVSGRITVEEGVWTRYKEYYLPGGILAHKVDTFEPFDKQWLREKEAVEHIITKRLPLKLLRHLDISTNIIKGGIVLTHPKSNFVGHSPRVMVGDVRFWCNQISHSPHIISLSRQDLFQIADIFINKFAQRQERLSSVSLAVTLFEENKVKLQRLLSQRSQAPFGCGEHHEVAIQI